MGTSGPRAQLRGVASECGVRSGVEWAGVKVRGRFGVKVVGVKVRGRFDVKVAGVKGMERVDGLWTM